MALKCPECGTIAHTRTSAYESATIKRTWYQCTNLDCSCTFTALESVEKIIMKPQKPAESEPKTATLSAARALPPPCTPETRLCARRADSRSFPQRR